MTRIAASSLLLALAWFAGVNLTMSLACWVVARAVRRSEPTTGTWPLVVRLLPAVASLVAVALFLPAQLRLEPAESGEVAESFGLVLYFAALAGALLLVASVSRAIPVARAGWRLRACARLPRVGVGEAVYEVADLAGVSLVGVLRTRILVGKSVIRELTAAELEVALAHEAAHRGALDNLKRCAMFCAPDFLGLSRVARRLEAEWHAAAECVADARAVGGSQPRALDLAAALLKVSWLSTEAGSWLASPSRSSLHEGPLLDMRVRRLIGGAARVARQPMRLGPAIALGAVALGLMASNAQVAGLIHDFTEVLIAVLP